MMKIGIGIGDIAGAPAGADGLIAQAKRAEADGFGSGSVSHWGSEYRVNAQLAVPGGKPCAILVAALAPKMLALTGREADGTITWMTGPKTIREHTAPRIREAAAQAGRPAPRVVVGL